MNRPLERWLGLALAALAVAVVGILLLRTSAEPERLVVATRAPATLSPGPTVEPRALPTLPPTVLARRVQESTAELALGEATQAAVLAPGGVALTDATTAVTEVRLGGGVAAPTAVVTDALAGISAIRLPEGMSASSLPIGDSAALVPGERLVIAPGGGAPVIPVTYLGRTLVMVDRAGLGQMALDFELPPDTRVTSGTVVDGAGRIVGIVVPARQATAPPGRAYATAIEQAVDLLRQLERPPGTPTPGVRIVREP